MVQNLLTNENLVTCTSILVFSSLSLGVDDLLYWKRGWLDYACKQKKENRFNQVIEIYQFRPFNRKLSGAEWKKLGLSCLARDVAG